MKQSIKRIALGFLAVILPCLGWAAEPWAAWTDFTGLTSSKTPDVYSTQNSINGSGFTFNLGSGVVQSDGSIITTGGSGTEAPYIDFGQSINVGYNNKPITVVMTVEMPTTLPTDVVKPLFFIGSNAPSGLGLTLKTLDETNGVTFGGAWEREGSTWNTNNAGAGFTVNTVKPAQVVTLSSSTSSGGLPLNVMVDGTMTPAGTISGLTGGSYNATRITLGNFHNTGTNTISYRIVNVAVFAGTTVSDEDVVLVAAKPTEYARTLESSEETWSTADQWEEGAAPEGSLIAVNLEVTAENGSNLYLDSSVTLFSLEVGGSKALTITGDELTTLKTTLNTDTDVSGITADLGAVTIAEGKTLLVGLNTKWTSISGAGTIKIEDAVISLNIAKNFNGSVTNATSSDTEIAGLAPVPGSAWVNLSTAGGNSALSATETSAIYWSGSDTSNLSDANISDSYIVTYSANNTYQWTNPSDNFLDVYLDDGEAHAQIAVQKIPFSNYSVIVYCATDQASRKFSPVTVNGTMYTVDEDGATKVATAATETFGACHGLTAQYANATAGNAIKIDNLTGPLTIVGGANNNNARGGIAAIQIVNTGDIIKYSTIEKTITEDSAYSTLLDTTEDVETVSADITIANGRTLTIDKVPAVGTFMVKTQNATDIVTVKVDLTDADKVRAVLDKVDTSSATGIVKWTLGVYTDKATWMAYEFNGTTAADGFKNTGVEGTSLTWDGGGAFGADPVDDEKMNNALTTQDENGNRALRLPARPWRNVDSLYPEAFTAVMYAKAGTTPNGVLVSFGSSTRAASNDKKNTISLATGNNPENNEMRLAHCGALNSAATDLVQNLAVPNSQISNHLYAFVMYVKDSKSHVEVYVDGELLTTYVFDSVITLGKGLQVGSIHGGTAGSGLSPLAFEKDDDGNLTSYDPATMDFIRVYDCLLSKEMLQAMAVEYPYSSPSGDATRTLDGNAANWIEADGSTVWSQNTLDENASVIQTLQNKPNKGTNIELNASAETELTINLPAETGAYESLTINGDVKLIAGADTEVLAVSGRTTINGNVTTPYNLVHLSTVTVATGKTLTIDASSIDLSSIYANQVIGLTGLIEKEDGATVTVKLPTSVPGRTAVATEEESGYVLSITVDGELNAHVPTADTTWETLVWRLGETTINKPADLTDLAIQLTAAEGATLTLTENVAAENYTLVNNLTVSGAMLNGVTLNPNIVLTTDVDSFTMASVKAATSVTKDVRPTVVLTADEVSLTGNQRDKVATWHNINLTISEGTTCTYPDDRNDWAGSTITVDGTFDASTAQIWLGVTYDELADADTKIIVSGTATIGEILLGPWGNTISNAIEVTDSGSLTINKLTTHEVATVTISVAEAATLSVNDSGTKDTSIENVTVAGTAKWVGTITGTLTLANGATLDVGEGLTVNGDITQQGDLLIKTSAEGGNTILTGGEGSSVNAEKITIVDRDDVIAEVDGTSIKLVTVAVCKIGDTEYKTLADALADAEANDTIVLVADAELTADAVLKPGVTLTVGDYTITGADTYLKDIAGNVVEGTSGSYVAPIYPIQLGSAYYTTLQGAIDAAILAGGGWDAITLLQNVTLTETVTVDFEDGSIMLNLNGKTLTGPGEDTAIYVKQGTLWVDNGSITNTGVVFHICEKNTADGTAWNWDNNNTAKGGVALALAENLYEHGVTVTSESNNCVRAFNGARFEMCHNVSLTSNSTSYATIQGSGSYANNVTQIVISGGSVTSTNNHAIYHPQPGTLTIGADGLTGPTISGVTGIEMRAGTLEMYSGTVTATGTYKTPDANNSGSTVEGAAIVLSQHTTDEALAAAIFGGTVTATDENNGKTLVVANTTGETPVSIFVDIEADVTIDTDAIEILVDSLMLAETDSGHIITPVVATIGETKYPSLPLAFAAANANATADEITIAANASIDLDAAIEVTTEVTLNLNGATISMTEEDTDGNGVFWVTTGGDLTINGDGVIAAVGNNDYCMAVWADGGKVTINGGTYNNLMTDEEAAAKKDPNHFDLIYVKKGGEIVINGGHFVCETPKWTLNSHDTLTGTITVKGGTFVEYDPANIDTEPESSGRTSWVADGYYTYATEPTNEETGTWYHVKEATVSNDITIDGDDSGIDLGDAAKAALKEIAAKHQTSITTVVVPTEEHSEALNDALTLFDDIVKIEGTTATVDWDFGITDIEVNRKTDGSLEGTVTIKAAVTQGDEDQSAARFVNGATLRLVDEETNEFIGDPVTINKNTEGVASFNVSLDVLQKHKVFKVKIQKD